jgi:hypothetical protein
VLFRFEGAGVLVYGFRAAISRHRSEGGIYVLYSPFGVGDDDAVGRLFHGRDQSGSLDMVSFPAHGLPQ